MNERRSAGAAAYFNAGAIIDRLERAAPVIPALALVADERDARWKPAPTEKHPLGAWSILEICVHLLDEEVDDFRARVRLTLEDPAAPWPRIDPEGRAVAEHYNARDFRQVIAQWVIERRASVAWLREVDREGTDWNVSHVHPRVGPVPAGELLVSWAAHDALHIRQIAKRLYEIATRDGAPRGYKTSYAGEWGA
jgi:hypothetical protein